MDEKLLTASARQAGRWVSESYVQGHANTAWAFATGHQLDEKLSTVLEKEAEQWVSESNVQTEELANTACAFATVHQLDEKLSTVLAKEAEQWVSESNVQELVNTAWAFATAKQSLCSSPLTHV